jgi:uncharacterized protein YbjT (DUF2867 family)
VPAAALDFGIMIAVIGATGNVGVPLVEQLAAAGEQVVAISRRAVARGGRGVVHRVADLAEPASLSVALRGAAAMFLLVAGSGEGLAAREIVRIASDAGVQRAVLLSSIGALSRPAAVSHEPLRQLEAELQRSALAWTILRPSGFDSNAFAWIPSIRAHRTVAAPFPDVAIPLVDPDDIAAVAAVALRDDAHASRIYTLTGPDAITPRRQAHALQVALDVELAFVELTRAQATDHMRRFMPATIVETTLDAIGTPNQVELRISADIERVLGRAPRSFDAWALRHAAAFR